MENQLGLIGNTPIVMVKTKDALFGNVFAKLEYFNPTHSLKDRIALAMVKDAESKGILNKDTTLVEPTSGNMGISLAFVCKIRGYRLILTMPENMSIERRKMAKIYGAQVVLTDAKLGFGGAIAKAKEIVASMENALNLDQYSNLANFEEHKNTGREIYDQMKGDVDIFIAGAGTCGCISGVSHYMKYKNPNFKSIAIEPVENDILCGGSQFSTHSLQGIGPNFIPNNFKADLIDKITHISKDEAKIGLEILSENAIAGGITSGATAFAAITEAKKPENKGKNIVFMVASFSERYLSTDMFDV
ncbi:PLP-dependent cysteine synthase family protein [Candidatus Deianiraea vastatrix]|uniref:cysteine synthase n=1 Tax=Candidatus Deianiraea vastatrix TaxID=2163644 RepID=A0A5B8XEN0_9RICK|nr:cysteine synthase [Candidatus Deianiraea vastatrix]QED22864.1 O-acetylserine sulfhydrylase [Candidatus Deianiraea vastatrix]